MEYKRLQLEKENEEDDESDVEEIEMEDKAIAYTPFTKEILLLAAIIFLVSLGIICFIFVYSIGNSNKSFGN